MTAQPDEVVCTDAVALDATEHPFARLLIEWRVSRGLSVVAAARVARASESRWRAWEAGSWPLPHRVHALAGNLGLEPDRVAAAIPSASLLRRARVAAGISASELARRLVVSRGLVSHWERSIATPHSDYFPSLATALGLDVAEVAELFVCAPPAKGEHVFVLGLPRARRAAGLSQGELAARAGAHVSTVGAWERGRKPIPSDRVTALAAAVGATPSRLLTGMAPSRREFSPLAQLRRNRGLSQREVAAGLGVGTKKLRGWETRGSVPQSVVADLAARYDVAPANLARLTAPPELTQFRATGRRIAPPWTASLAPRLWAALFEGLPTAEQEWVVRVINRYLPPQPVGYLAVRR